MVKISGFLIMFCFAAFLVFVTTGCTVGSGAVLKPQSHFDFPNSNVIPLGKVQGEASSTGFFPNPMDADLMEQAVNNALRQKGGDLLIDYTLYYKITSMVILPLYTTTITVDGTACKMEIGEKILK